MGVMTAIASAGVDRLMDNLFIRKRLFFMTFIAYRVHHEELAIIARVMCVAVRADTPRNGLMNVFLLKQLPFVANVAELRLHSRKQELLA